MTDFGDREKAFETKFVRDEETAFKINARRNKLLGFWAAGLLEYTDAQAEAYAKEVIASDFEAAGDDDVVAKLVKDFEKAGLSVIEKDIRLKMEQLYKEAVKQIAG